MKNHRLLLLSLTFGAIIILLFAPKTPASEPDSENIAALLRFPQTKSHAEELKPDTVYARQLNGREKHLFTVRAEAGKCLRFVIEQNGIDVMITVKKTEEEFLKKVDRPSGAFGRETVTFIVLQTGIFTVEIKAWTKDAIDGNYEITYTVADSPTEADRKRDLAENLTSEAEVLRGEGSGENKEKALQKFAEVLSVWQELDDIYEQAVVYYGIGFTHYGSSNNYEAARHFNRALNLHLQTGNEFGQALNQTWLGITEYSFNENELAVYNIQKAIEIYKKIGSARGLGMALNALGTVQFLSEKHHEAIGSLTESLRWRVLANDSRGKAVTHISLGKIYLFLGFYEKAGRQFLKAKKSLGETRAKEDAELLYYFGRFYLATGRLDEARKNLEESLIFYRRKGNKNGEALVLLDLSRILARTEEIEKALEYIQTALDLIEQARQAVLDYRARINFFATVQPFYEHYVSLLMKMHDRAPEKGFDRKALEISEQARARGLLDRLERRRLIKQEKIQPELLERERRLRDELTGVLARKRNENSIQATVKIQEISSQFIEIESEINRGFGSSETVSLPTLTVEKIQSYLDENTVLLEYALAGSESFLWVVSNAEVKSFRLAASEKIESEARAVYECISKPASVKGEANCRRKIYLLSENLLRPATGDIQNKRLIIVKQGFLQYIPFAALFNPTNQDYLIKTNEIVNLPSASILSFIGQTKFEEPAKKTLAVFGDPIFSPTDGRLSKNGIPPPERFSRDENKNLPRLFASKFEIERISSFVPAEKILVKTDAAANRQTVFNSNLENYRILHFATHTLTDDREPEISAIVLSSVDENGKAVNGFLRANDILRIDLNADLVVLSSCRSGIGKQVKGEGMISLANSFFAAGAARLLVSLWAVNDKVTAEFMVRFYRKHLKEKKSFSVSLREAQIEIMRDRRWDSPFYWSAFVLQGE